MLEIHYVKNGSQETAQYEDAKAFLASQYLEVPPFQDQATIGGLFHFLTTQTK